MKSLGVFARTAMQPENRDAKLQASIRMIARSSIPITFGLVGWALCGVTMSVGMKMTTLEAALILHAVAAPVIFTVISLVYFRRYGSWSPLRTAAAFLGVVVAMDVFVVALLIQRSFEMFASILGTWLPFLLIFISTWWAGLAARRASHPPTAP